MHLPTPKSLAVAIVLAARASAESHTISITNNCGFGNPVMLVNGTNITIVDNQFTASGPLNAITWLQSSGCSLGSGNCTVVSASLDNNITTKFQGSQLAVYLDKITPAIEPVCVEYMGGCDGQGWTCEDDAGCTNANHSTPIWGEVLPCKAQDVNVSVTFCECGSGTAASPSSSSASASSTAAAAAVAGESTSPTSSHIGAIIGGTLGAAAALILSAAGFVAFRRRKTRSRYSPARARAEAVVRMENMRHGHGDSLGQVDWGKDVKAPVAA